MGSKRNKSLIKQVNDFDQRMHDRELVFKRPSVKNKDLNNKFNEISQELSQTLGRYRTQKSHSFKEFWAKLCLFWIDRAHTMGFIEDGEGIISRTKKLENDNKRLQSEIKECKEKCQKLEEEIKEIHGRFPDTKRFMGKIQGA